MTLRWIAWPVLVLMSAAPARAQTQAQDKMRFQAMDENHDGRITQKEWRGSPTSFKRHDWNHDGVLSGDEVRLGAARRQDNDRGFESAQNGYEFDDWSAEGFSGLDHNHDNRITRDEWHFDWESFRRADHNADGIVTRREFLSEDGEDDDRDDAFPYLDVNRDGRLSKSEWHGGNATFKALDENGDGFLSRVEMSGQDAPPDLFESLDVNHDRSLSPTEWHWPRASFDRLDVNRDGRMTPEEFAGTASQRTPAYEAGYQRGLVEGRAAGREDRERNQGWDLEGQRELETADSGYQPVMGPKAEFQAGYRAAFRLAYREGWNLR
jgi:Ca2+-binding EF-hand superfamily protein